MAETLIGRFRHRDGITRIVEEEPTKKCEPVADDTNEARLERAKAERDAIKRRLDAQIAEGEDPDQARRDREYIESGASAKKAEDAMAAFVSASNKRHGIGPVVVPNPDEPEPSLQSPTCGMSPEVKRQYESALALSPANETFKKRTSDLSPMEQFVANSNKRHAPNPAYKEERQRRIRIND